MLAVVRISGNQFKVEKDKKIIIPYFESKEGDKLEFKEVLLLQSNGNVSLANTNNSVHAEVIKHFDGDKVIAFKMKRRKGYRKKKGHRTQYTQIKITNIQ